jgi:hypothetical protein
MTDGIDAREANGAIEGSNEIIHASRLALAFTVNRDIPINLRADHIGRSCPRGARDILLRKPGTGHSQQASDRPMSSWCDQSQFEEFHAQTH